jgi:hypothetical protein
MSVSDMVTSEDLQSWAAGLDALFARPQQPLLEMMATPQQDPNLDHKT